MPEGRPHPTSVSTRVARARHDLRNALGEIIGFSEILREEAGDLGHTHLQAAMRGDRISVLYSSKDYSSEWGYHPDNKRFLSVDNTRFGVNIVVYALTR